MATDPTRSDPSEDDSTSFEVDRHTDDQPPRDDLIDPEDIDPSDGDPLDGGAGLVDDPDPFHRDDEPPRYGTDEDLLPESQGYDADVAEQLAEDDAVRHALSDEEE